MLSNFIHQNHTNRLQFSARTRALLLLLCLSLTGPGFAQSTFTSGSTGADGPLNVTAPGTTYFDPATIPNHKAGDTIFNFTTITIAKGSTLRLDAQNIPGPVYWLASGDVNIAGTLDLSGLPGHPITTKRVERVYSIPGAGGFAGGPAGSVTTGPEPGAGPGGGAVGACTGNGTRGSPGTFSGSQYLIPLIGGSGGGGSCSGTAGDYYPGGGAAGGGAILIASSTQAILSGSISAKGGDGIGNSAGGAGSGGAIRLVANSITNAGTLDVSGGATNNGTPGGSGFLRLESNQLAQSGSIYGSYTTSIPFLLALPATGPSVIQVSTVNGLPVNSTHFTFPDVTISTTQPVPVVVIGQNVPIGAIATLYVLSETGPDGVYVFPPMTGTLQNSSSTLNISYPPGGSRGIIRATWTN